MNTELRYESAKEIYRTIGVDTDQAIKTLKDLRISMHCWQGDDVKGFDQEGPLSGGIQTNKLMRKYSVAIWAHHGMFCSGEDYDITFGLAHTVEKSAEILVKVLSMRPDKLQTITTQNFRDLAVGFKVSLPEEFLYEK